MGGATGNLTRSTTSKWHVAGTKNLPDNVYAKNVHDAKRQVEAMMTMPKGWQHFWLKESNGSYIMVWQNSKGTEQRSYQVLLRKATVKVADGPGQRVRSAAKAQKRKAARGTTKTLKAPSKVEAIRDAGLAYHVESPAQFVNMIASKGGQVIVAAVDAESGGAYIGYYGDDEAPEVAKRLSRMRKTKFNNVTIIN